ncbi:MAG: large protein [Chitinophagaceae bacterium]|nr:large protein [Chitinophagaceae bacterium]
MKHYCFALLAFAASLSNAWAQPGALDPAFATKGLKKFSFRQNLSADQALASVLDASGNLYVAGFETNTNGGQNPFVVKMLPSGKLDQSFGKEGKSTFHIGYSPSDYFYPNAIALQDNGKIVLAGYYYYTGDGTIPYASVLRLNANGSLDVDFGNQSGYSTYNTQSTYSSVVIKNDTIFATGGTYTPSNPYADFIISVYDSTGYPVYINGYPGMSINFSGPLVADYATCSALDGDILYVGGMTQDANGYAAFGYSAFNTKTLDTVAGRSAVLLPMSAGSLGTLNTCTAIKVTSNHEVLLGGYVDYGNSNNQRDFLLYKLNASGQPDLTFSAAGYQTYKLGTNLYNSITTMLLDGNNIVLAGSSNISYADIPMWGATRVNTSSGIVDAGFSSANISNIKGSDECITSVTKLSDGSYYFVGTWSSTNNEDALVKKVTNNGSNVTGFGSGSKTNFWIEDYDGIVTDLAKRPDGKFWISGYYKDPSDTDDKIKFGALALLNSDGSTDTTTVKGNGDVGVINIATLMQTYSGFENAVVTAIEVETAGTLLVAGTYLTADDSTGAFLIRLGMDGTLQSFNGGSTFNSFNMGNCYPHEVIIQPNNYILVSGYARGMQAVARFTNLGTTDPSFGTAGVFVFSDAHPNDDLELNYVQAKLQSDGKIVCAGTYFTNDSSGDFLVFRLTSAGQLDDTGPGLFGAGGFYTKALNNEGTDFALAVAIKSNGQILAGGMITNGSNSTYAILQLNNDGSLDSTFGNSLIKGVFIHDAAGYPQQAIRTLNVESVNAIVATGVAGDDKGDYYSTALRITATGKLDQTFIGQGHKAIALGYTRTAKLYNGQLYIIGGTNQPRTLPVKGQIARLNLGTGPIIKTTNLKLPDHLNVTFGDVPFTLKPITNSYGPITYSVLHGADQGTVDPKTGLVTIIGVPGGEEWSLEVQAYQAPVPGYIEAYASVKIYINRALPTIVFTDQGGLVGDTIRLSFQTNADTSGGNYGYSFSSPNFQPYTQDSVIILAEGSAEITLTLYSSQNYDYAASTATVHGYIKAIIPVAADDQVELIQGLNEEVDIPVLANDQAYTGNIVPYLIDLDPSTKAIDSVYFSSALGAFKTDRAGVVHYIPFQGLVGGGEISYTITDSRGDVSAPAKISVSVKLLGQRPALKATELVTPNNDGLNDAFVIGYVDFEKENTLRIYDRNGQELLTLDNYRNDWEGTLPNGKQVENGIYYYLFREGNDERELKGSVEFKK